MKKNEWIWPLGLLGAIIAGATFVHYQPHRSGDVAAWVQAFGSVFAIVATYAVASRQQRGSEKAARIDRIRDRYRSSSYAIALLEEAVLAISDFQTQIAVQDTGSPLNFEKTRLEQSLSTLLAALHQPLPSEILNEILVGLRAVQNQTRLAHAGANTKTEKLQEFTHTHFDWVNGAFERVKMSQKKWKNMLDESADIE